MIDSKPHVMFIKQLKRGICMECGSLLVRRVNRKTGMAFVGCRGFPNCTNSISMDVLAREYRKGTIIMSDLFKLEDIERSLGKEQELSPILHNE